LRWIKAVGLPLVSFCIVESHPDILPIAEAMIRRYGDRASDVVAQRAARHLRDEKIMTAMFWSRVVLAIWEIDGGPPALAG
jgi:hypothetical protein